MSSSRLEHAELVGRGTKYRRERPSSFCSRRADPAVNKCHGSKAVHRHEPGRLISSWNNLERNVQYLYELDIGSRQGNMQKLIVTSNLRAGEAGFDDI